MSIKQLIKPVYKSIRKFLGVKYSGDFYKSRKLTNIQKKIIGELHDFKSNSSIEEGVILVQLVRDYEYTIKLAAASKVIFDFEKLKVNIYNARFTHNLRLWK